MSSRAANPSGKTWRGSPLAGVLYAADMAFHFHCSFVAVHRFKRRAVVDGRLVAWFYVRHGSFFVDLLSILPTLELVPHPCPPDLMPDPHKCMATINESWCSPRAPGGHEWAPGVMSSR